MTDEHTFDSTYGNGAFARLHRMLQESTLSYAQIGQEFGLTRQRVSQLAQLFGINGRRRDRTRVKRRLPYISHERDKYSFKIRLVLAELKRRGITVAPYYTVDLERRVAWKHLTTVLVNGVPCKIGYRDIRRVVDFTTFHIRPPVRKAKAVVWGIQRGSKFRFYVIPLSELKEVKRINIPVPGKYKWTWRKPNRDWTRFENAWNLLHEGPLKHSSYTTRRE